MFPVIRETADRNLTFREPLTIHNAGRVERSDKIAGSDFGPPEAGPAGVASRDGRHKTAEQSI